jgi:hypothetical protein
MTKKENNPQLTVLSSFGLVRENGEIEIVGLGSGTKCIQRKDLEGGVCRVHQCHAEVIARRSLRQWLLNQCQ